MDPGNIFLGLDHNYFHYSCSQNLTEGILLVASANTWRLHGDLCPGFKVQVGPRGTYIILHLFLVASCTL